MELKPGQLVVVQDSPIRWGNSKQWVFTFKSNAHGTTSGVLPTLTLGLFLKYVSRKSVLGTALGFGSRFALVLFGETVECLRTEDFEVDNSAETKQ